MQNAKCKMQNAKCKMQKFNLGFKTTYYESFI